MASKIKLQRKGAKKKPIFTVIVQDESLPTKGRIIEVLGYFNPMAEPSVFEVDKEKTAAWLKKGAEPTEKVRILLGQAGILPPVDLAALHKRKPKNEQKSEEGAAPVKTEEKPAESKPEESKPEENKPAPETEAKTEEKNEEVK